MRVALVADRLKASLQKMGVRIVCGKNNRDKRLIWQRGQSTADFVLGPEEMRLAMG
jgi:hypothetical protein